MREQLHQSNTSAWLAGRPDTAILAGLTLLVLALSLPESRRDAFDRREFTSSHVHRSRSFPNGSPAPVDFRFVLQGLVAPLLGIRRGLPEARAGRRADVVRGG